jgi:hypothetical protein
VAPRPNNFIPAIRRDGGPGIRVRRSSHQQPGPHGRGGCGGPRSRHPRRAGTGAWHTAAGRGRLRRRLDRGAGPRHGGRQRRHPAQRRGHPGRRGAGEPTERVGPGLAARAAGQRTHCVTAKQRCSKGVIIGPAQPVIMKLKKQTMPQQGEVSQPSLPRSACCRQIMDAVYSGKLGWARGYRVQ